MLVYNALGRFKKDNVLKIVIENNRGNGIVEYRKIKCWDTSDNNAVYSWKKRVAFVGSYKYPDAYKDFHAKMFLITIPIEDIGDVKKIVLENQSKDKIYIWGMGIL